MVLTDQQPTRLQSENHSTPTPSSLSYLKHTMPTIPLPLETLPSTPYFTNIVHSTTPGHIEFAKLFAAVMALNRFTAQYWVVSKNSPYYFYKLKSVVVEDHAAFGRSAQRRNLRQSRPRGPRRVWQRADRQPYHAITERPRHQCDGN